MFFVQDAILMYLQNEGFELSFSEDDAYQFTAYKDDYYIDFNYDRLTVYYWHEGDELRKADWMEHSERIRLPDTLLQFKALLYGLGITEKLER